MSPLQAHSSTTDTSKPLVEPTCVSTHTTIQSGPMAPLKHPNPQLAQFHAHPSTASTELVTSSAVSVPQVVTQAPSNTIERKQSRAPWQHPTGGPLIPSARRVLSCPMGGPLHDRPSIDLTVGEKTPHCTARHISATTLCVTNTVTCVEVHHAA